jgi:hypothetical protein
VLSSVDATFLDDTDRASLRNRLLAELAAFRQGMAPAGRPG